MKHLFLRSLLLVAALTGCASNQVRFEPWKGLPKESLADLQQGIFAVPKEKLLDAAAATLEHEPYLHWTFDRFDKSNGLILGSAGVFREVQLRVADVDGGKSRLAVSVPQRVLKSQAKIYVLKSDPSRLTAYEPAREDLNQYNVLAADAELNEAYFYSFTYRVLNDRSQVPFSLKAYDDPEPIGQPPVQASSPAPLEAAPSGLSPVAAAATSSPVTPTAAVSPQGHQE